MSSTTLAPSTSTSTSAPSSHASAAITNTTSTASTSTAPSNLPLTFTAAGTTSISTTDDSTATKALQVPLPDPLPSPPHTATTPALPTLVSPTTTSSSTPFSETEHQRLDRWAFALANWVIPRWDRPIRELDGWRTVCGMHGGFVRDCSLSVFVLLGAVEEIPFTVYRELDMGNEETIEPAVAWMRDLRARRMLHSVLTLDLLQDISPLPCV